MFVPLVMIQNLPVSSPRGGEQVVLTREVSLATSRKRLLNTANGRNQWRRMEGFAATRLPQIATVCIALLNA